MTQPVNRVVGDSSPPPRFKRFRARQDTTMDSKSNLPVDVVERVLSFLPIPAVCRNRVVCKEWNELTKNATFYALCNKNGVKEDYLFLWRKDTVLATGLKCISPHFGETFHFFDLDMDRWYSIPSTQIQWDCGCNSNDIVQWFLGMDYGLVCEVIPIENPQGRTLCLSILDPVAKTTRRLPSPDVLYPPPRFEELDPSLVIVVDPGTQRYKVFFFNILKDMPLAYVLESGTQEWRPVEGLSHPMEDAIAFQNTAFAILNQGALSELLLQLRLFRYEVERDSFLVVWQINFRRRVVYSKLIVRHNRLFLVVITRLPRIIILSDSESESESEPDSDSDSDFECACGCPCEPDTGYSTFQDEKGALFEMYEILPDERSSKPVVQFKEEALSAIWDGDVCTNYWFAFPCFDSNGDYSAVVLMHHHTGEMRRFHLATGAVDVLPACPLSATIPQLEGVTSTFDAKTMPLRLSDVLKNSPPTA